MRAIKGNIITLWVLILLVLPFAALPLSTAWSPGDEEAIFGHKFTDEYWTNSSLHVEGTNGNASLTASYVGVGEFSAFLIAFNEITTNDGDELIIPYQLFGMHYRTPNNQEVFIAAIFAFLMVHNESYGNNQIPDVGNEDSWYLVPVGGAGNPWGDVTPAVEPINATKIGDGDNHYRFGMRYTDLPARIVASAGAGFLLTLGAPILTVLISELVVTYDILIDESGEVHAETLYTVGEVKRAKWLGIFDVDPAEIMNETLKLTAVHYMSIWTSNYNITGITSGNDLANPATNIPMDENVTIKIGDSERAFDIGFGRSYTLWNESTDPYSPILGEYTAINTVLAAQASDFLLIAWQAPLSVYLFSHMAYGLSTHIQSTYTGPADLVSHAGTAFDNSQLWYGVTFPDWNGSRIEQDPVYTAYTNLAMTTTTTGGDTPENGILGLILIVGVIAIIVVLIRRRR